jgi:DNA-binding NtrC family response regulator
VGGDRDIPVDVRVISATHRDLRAMVNAGTFREDLFFRLVVFPIELPPLRTRVGDLPLLIGHFLRHYATSMGLAVPEVSTTALQTLARHPWPGNVRELQNTIQFSLLASRGDEVRPEHLPPSVSLANGADASAPDDPDVVRLRDGATGDLRSYDDIERDVFRKARELNGGNMTRTAQALGVGRATLYRKLSPSPVPGPA